MSSDELRYQLAVSGAMVVYWARFSLLSFIFLGGDVCDVVLGLSDAARSSATRMMWPKEYKQKELNDGFSPSLFGGVNYACSYF